MILKKIKQIYDISFVSIAKKLEMDRNQLCRIARSEMLTVKGHPYYDTYKQLKKLWPKAFSDKREIFTGENKDIVDLKYKTPTNFPRTKSLKCRIKGHYYMKASTKDLEKARPICPICKEEMLTNEERKEMGLDF